MEPTREITRTRTTITKVIIIRVITRTRTTITSDTQASRSKPYKLVTAASWVGVTILKHISQHFNKNGR